MTQIQATPFGGVLYPDADVECIAQDAYKRGFADAIHVAEEWQEGRSLTRAAIRTMQWRAVERVMGRDPYRTRNGSEENDT